MKPAPNLIPLLARLSSEVLLIRQGCAPLVTAIARRAVSLVRELRADLGDGPEDCPDDTMPWEEAEAVTLHPGGIAIVPVRGVICAGLDQLTAWCFGLCRPEAIQTACAQLAADPTVRLVIFDIDSPGGYTTAVPETATIVADLTARKSTLAFTSGMMCSAAYWLGSQCEKIAVTPSSTIGSVGTYATIYDFSKMFEEAGITTHLIAAGKFKGQGTPGEPISEEFIALMQASVDKINGQFLAAVASGRGSVASEDTQGQWFDGETAVSKNLADVTVLTRAELLSAIVNPSLENISGAAGS